MDGEGSAGPGTDSDWTDSTSFASCETESGLEGAVDEFDNNVPEANFHAPSKTVFQENGTVGEESSVGGVETSGSGSTEGIVDGSVAKTDSLGSVGSDTGDGVIK
jgi:hypothetical protein